MTLNKITILKKNKLINKRVVLETKRLERDLPAVLHQERGANYNITPPLEVRLLTLNKRPYNVN